MAHHQINQIIDSVLEVRQVLTVLTNLACLGGNDYAQIDSDALATTLGQLERKLMVIENIDHSQVNTNPTQTNSLDTDETYLIDLFRPLDKNRKNKVLLFLLNDCNISNT